MNTKMTSIRDRCQQVGVIALGGGLDARWWYDNAVRKGFIAVWDEGCILLYVK